jgi:antitoxin component YwqK of YwqJK toxin-antitoxin module
MPKHPILVVLAIVVCSSVQAGERVLCTENLKDPSSWAEIKSVEDRHGTCRYFLGSGDKPFGEQIYNHGKKSGAGKVFFDGGSRLEAVYVDGKLDGELKEVRADGTNSLVRKFKEGKLLSEKSDYHSKEYPQVEEFHPAHDAVLLTEKLPALSCGDSKYIEEAGDLLGDTFEIQIKGRHLAVRHMVGDGEPRIWNFTGDLNVRVPMQVLKYDTKNEWSEPYREGEMRFTLSPDKKMGQYHLKGRSYAQYRYQKEQLEPIDIRLDVPEFREIDIKCKPTKVGKRKRPSEAPK